MVTVLALSACGPAPDGGGAVNVADPLIVNGRVVYERPQVHVPGKYA